jgi:hypothetical protein
MFFGYRGLSPRHGFKAVLRKAVGECGPARHSVLKH